MLVKNEPAGAYGLIWLSVEDVGALPFHRVGQTANIPDFLSPDCPELPGPGDLSAWDRVISE